MTLASDDEQPSDEIAHAFTALVQNLQRTITLQLGDRTTTLTLADPASNDAHDQPLDSGGFVPPSAQWMWNPTAKPLPDWTLSGLVLRVAAAEPRARLDAVRLERDLDGQTRSWTINLRAANPAEAQIGIDASPSPVRKDHADLAAGDRLVIPLQPAADPPALAARRQAINFAAPGRFFTEQVFARASDPIGTPTLGELIMQAYLDPMILPYPDFSKIVIHRLKGDAGEEESLPVDLLAAMQAPALQTPADARRADVALQWGDVVEIPVDPVFHPEPWTHLDPLARAFLNLALSRDLPTTVNGQRLLGMVTQLHPAFYNLYGDHGPAPHWLGAKGRIDNGSPFTAKAFLRGLQMPLENVVRLSVQLGDQTQDYDTAALRTLNPWLNLGSRVDIQDVAPDAIPPTQAAGRRNLECG